MNLAEILKVPEKQWVDNVTLEVVDVSQDTIGKYGYEQDIQVSDGLKTMTLKLQVNSKDPILALDHRGQMSFRIKWFNSQGGPKIVGYPTGSKKPITPLRLKPQVAPPIPQKEPTQFQQETKQWETEEKAEERHIKQIRADCIQAACTLHQGEKMINIIKVAKEFERYVTGIVDENQTEDFKPSDSDEIPF